MDCNTRDKLYAWANRTKIGLGEHTWVTTYTPGSGEPNPNLGDYWYCWGDAHDEAQQLSVGIGGCEFARRIAEPHNPKADVGIRYLHDGVCHQMANRLLRFCLDEQDKPVTVRGARGYQLSVAMYGVYGGELNRRDSRCIEKWNNVVSKFRCATQGKYHDA